MNLTISFFYFRQEGKFVSSGKDDADHLTILNILLQNPEEFQLKQKPSAIREIRENKIFTLDMREIPVSSAEADDNGAYISKGSATRSRTAHKSENGTWYVNVRKAKTHDVTFLKVKFMSWSAVTV